MTTNIITTNKRTAAVKRAALIVMAGLFITFGFAIDGISEVGHHAGFILGGMSLGYSFARQRPSS